ncbi:hypothetical protein DH2020_003771 [Rehmannia glutinosa]|uniref:Mannosyl-oligosaccharide glucosidase n=1 Tax=Rehmannia glutinosa TaxID=99300 RepID=A0ABR0XML3_REHGL
MNNYFVNPLKETVKPRVVTPLPAPKLMDLPMFEGEHKESLYWGTYRPHVYFGIRARVVTTNMLNKIFVVARTPQSLLAGLMWIGVKDGRYFMRHVCQDSDELKTYGWTHHNGRDYGRQGCDRAADPTLPACRDILNKEMAEVVHLFFYVADEGGTALGLGRGTSDIPDDYILAFGSRNDLGSWELHLESKDEFEFHYAGFKTHHIHNLSDLVQANLGIQARKIGRLQLSDTSDDAPNILVFQISAMIPFKADVAFVSKSSSSTSRTEERIRSLIGDSLTSRLEQKQKQFDDKFQRCFEMSDELNSEAITVGKAALGNLLGGIGYFYGQSKISLPPSSNPVPGDNHVSYWPAELCTAVPSRPFFPRGFLWDEGAEALSKVPSEFVLQHPTNGNPPTLFLVLKDLVCGIKKNKFTASEINDISIFLRRAFVRLDAWFKWFNTTQSGKDEGTYFWHGRDNATIRELNPKSLSSGLDDYPRASHPSEDERHLDLRCWMHLAADCMSSISEFLEDSGVGKEYGLTAKLLSDFELLNQMHFDYTSGAYFDYGNHTEKVRLSWRMVEAAGGYPTRELVREVLEKPVLRLVPHIGYVSLFPFMGRLIPPESWILGKQLDLISNTSTLWTNYGLRSLAKTRNVVSNYNQTGYLWEQYDQKKGKGKGARLFTGWTSLIVLIMSEAYDDC